MSRSKDEAVKRLKEILEKDRKASKESEHQKERKAG